MHRPLKENHYTAPLHCHPHTIDGLTLVSSLDRNIRKNKIVLTDKEMVKRERESERGERERERDRKREGTV